MGAAVIAVSGDLHKSIWGVGALCGEGDIKHGPGPTPVANGWGGHSQSPPLYSHSGTPPRRLSLSVFRFCIEKFTSYEALVNLYTLSFTDGTTCIHKSVCSTIGCLSNSACWLLSMKMGNVPSCVSVHSPPDGPTTVQIGPFPQKRR